NGGEREADRERGERDFVGVKGRRSLGAVEQDISLRRRRRRNDVPVRRFSSTEIRRADLLISSKVS
uniref:Uncharacterized protein n=1 Tax=Oryza barthii TaxID=65489 RepID=A0A0D3HCT5_9ORYZ